MAYSELVPNFGGIQIDTRMWPVIIWEMPPALVSDVSTAQAFAYLKELLERRAPGEKVFQLTDVSRAPGSTAGNRKIAADFMTKNEALIVESTLGGATVLTSAVMRGVLTAVFWLKPPPVPTKVVAVREDGFRYGLELLEAHRSPLPAHLQALRRDFRLRSTG